MSPARSVFAALLALAFTATPAPAQAPGERQPRKPPPIPKARVTGHVLCNDTRQPARGAVVMLQRILPADTPQRSDDQQSAGTFVVRTGLDGTYTVEHVPAGDYGVLAYLPGYLSPLDDLMLGGGDEGNPNTLMQERLAKGGVTHVGNDGTQTADMTLERGATVSGRVLYVDGSPATQVNIDLQDIHAKAVKAGEQTMNLGAMYRSVFTHQTTGTDDQGHFRVSGIHPGTYRIAAAEPFSMPDRNGGDSMGVAMGMSLMGGSSNPAAVHFYVGDTIHQRAAKTFELHAGDILADLEIRLPIDGFHTFQVKLSAPDGRPINNAEVTLVDNADDSLQFRANFGSSPENGGTPNPDGTFLFHQVPPGTYTLSVKGAVIFLAMPMPADASPRAPEEAPSAGIGAVAGGSSETRFVMPAGNRFADSTAAVIVKDSDPPDLNLTLAQAKAGATP